MNILRRGRLEVAPGEDIMRFTSSMEADKRIFDSDIQVDKAHVVMLKEQGIINEGDCSAILSGLEKIQKEGISALDTSYEDVHIALEARLIEMVGEDTGGRMHSFFTNCPRATRRLQGLMPSRAWQPNLMGRSGLAALEEVYIICLFLITN